MKELAYERKFREWAAGQGVGWKRVRYPRPAAGGETLAYHLTPASPARGVVLAVHGAGNDALFALVGLFKDLLRRRFEVFSFDMDGHGRLSTTRFASESVADAVEAAAARCDPAARSLPLHVVGVSLGGSVLLHALPRLGDAVASAVLMAAPLRIQLSGRAVRAELRPRLLRTLWREREHYGLWGLVPAFGPIKRGIYPLRLADPVEPGAFGYVDALNRALESLRLEEAARRIHCPVLLVYGDGDVIVPVEQGERLARLIPHAELLRLPEETHLTAPLAPAATARVLGWLEGRQADAAPGAGHNADAAARGA